MLSVTPKDGPNGQIQLHASTVRVLDRAIALVGPSGVGKSKLAIELISLGAELIADDVTWFRTTMLGVIATCPPALMGRIEARGIGILNVVPAAPSPLGLVVDLGQPEAQRLPDRKTCLILNEEIPLLHTPETGHTAAAIMLYMEHGRAD